VKRLFILIWVKHLIARPPISLISHSWPYQSRTLTQDCVGPNKLPLAVSGGSPPKAPWRSSRPRPRCRSHRCASKQTRGHIANNISSPSLPPHDIPPHAPPRSRSSLTPPFPLCSAPPQSLGERVAPPAALPPAPAPAPPQPPQENPKGSVRYPKVDFAKAVPITREMMEAREWPLGEIVFAFCGMAA
jgi:hypothetical protein